MSSGPAARAYGRPLFLLAGTALITAVAGLSWAAVGSDPPDHAFDVARSAFEGNPACPAGDQIGVSQWEKLQKLQSKMRVPAGADPGAVPPVDFVLVVPYDPAPFLHGSEIPAGMMAMVPCVAVSEDELVLASSGVNLIPEGIMKTGLGSEEQVDP